MRTSDSRSGLDRSRTAVCDYRFEAVAYFDDQQLERQPLAA